MNHDAPLGLRELEARIARDLDDLAYPARKWVLPTVHSSGQHVWNVVILGAGMSGLGVGFGLMREKIDNFLIVDRAGRGKEGPWATYARMRTLRTDKMQSSIDGGIPSLHFNKYFEARFGREAWDAMVRSPTDVWMDYLNWYRQLLDLPVENGIEVTRIEPEGDLLWIHIVKEGRPDTLLARKLVVATGYDGAGGPSIPDIVASSLPRERYFHSTEMIDFSQMRGKTVGVIGCGASAFDNASAALEAGAAVHMIARTSTLEHRRMSRTVEYAGLKSNFYDMPDLMRWRFARHLMGESNPPPPQSVARARGHDGFSLHLQHHLKSITCDARSISIETDQRRFELDHLILGTGFFIDATRRTEFAGWTADITLWHDVFTPEIDDRHRGFDNAAYLGPGFELIAKDSAKAPHLRHIHDFSWGAWPSMGPITAGISGMQFGLRRLLPALSKALFIEDVERYWDDACDWTDEELRSGNRVPRQVLPL